MIKIHDTSKHTLRYYKVSSATLNGKTSNGILIDSGSSVHLFRDETAFTSWDTDFDPDSIEIILADGRICNDIRGRGRVTIEVNDATGNPHTIMLNDALYMPTCDHAGIISVKRGIASGDEFHFLPNNCYMVNGGIKIPLLEKKKLYYVNAIRTESVVRRSALEWHDIMGHLNFKSIYEMPKMVSGMEITHKNKRHCVTCIQGKAQQNLSRIADRRSDSPFAFVHSDISGPKNVEDTFGSYNYVVVFVCDFSGFLVVYNMKNKSDVVLAFEKFLQFTARFGKVKRIRTDKANEYTSEAFESVCKKNLIHHETSARYTPSQNGTAERAFGTLTPHVRCLLIHSSMPQRFWPLAYKYAAHLYNRSPVERIGCTPFQLVYGYKPNVTKLHKFGSPVQTLVMKPESKLHPRTVPGIFVGFDPQSSAYQVWYENEDECRESTRVFFYTENDEPAKTATTPSAELLQSEPSSSTSPAEYLPEVLDPRNGLGAGDGHPAAADDVIYTTPVTGTRNRRWREVDKNHPPSLTRPQLRPRVPRPPPSDSPSDDVTSPAVTRKQQHRRRRPRRRKPRATENTPGLISPEGSRSLPCRSRNQLQSHTPIDYQEHSIDHDNCNMNSGNGKSTHSVTTNGIERPTRSKKNPVRFGNPINLGDDYVFNVKLLDYCYNVNQVPQSYSEAMKSYNKVKWKLAMDKEYKSLLKHNTFVLVDRPTDHEVITGRWVFSFKNNLNPIDREKARWVARGFLQKYGESFTDTFAPMSRMTTIRVLMLFCAYYGFIAHQIDIETAYLNAELDHTIYIEQPQGFCKDKSKVCLLRKSLYGLKQSAKLWNENVHTFLLEIGFIRANADLCLYRKQTKHGIIFLVIWVDDIVILSNNVNLIKDFKQQISNKYTVKDLGVLSYFLGIEFNVTGESVHMSQSGYCKSILERFGMTDCSPMKIPCEKNIHDELRAHQDSPIFENPTRYRELVGSLIYLQQVTRPDISFIKNILGQNMSQPTQFTWELGLKTLRYLKGTIDLSLNYYKTDKLQLTGFSDADWGNAIDRKSQSGYCFYLSPNSSPVSWTSRKQKLVATSTCNSEYIALSEAVSECIWLQQLLKDLNMKGVHSRPANMYCDNTSAIALSRNACHHRRSKHIDIKYHHVRDHLAQGTITLDHVPSNDNIADGFTKALAFPLFNKFKCNLQKLY